MYNNDKNISIAPNPLIAHGALPKKKIKTNNKKGVKIH